MCYSSLWKYRIAMEWNQWALWFSAIHTFETLKTEHFWNLLILYARKALCQLRLFCIISADKIRISRMTFGVSWLNWNTSFRQYHDITPNIKRLKHICISTFCFSIFLDPGRRHHFLGSLVAFLSFKCTCVAGARAMEHAMCSMILQKQIISKHGLCFQCHFKVQLKVNGA